MKLLKTSISIIIMCISFSFYAQEGNKNEDEKITDKASYYEKRAAEDAKFEQQFKAESETEAKAFWEDQKAYEKELKQRDRKSYRAYMRGKRDAYAEHYEHCNDHCHHGERYYYHASFYYYRYDGYYYNRYPRRSTINTSVRVNLPSVRIGI